LVWESFFPSANLVGIFDKRRMNKERSDARNGSSYFTYVIFYMVRSKTGFARSDGSIAQPEDWWFGSILLKVFGTVANGSKFMCQLVVSSELTPALQCNVARNSRNIRISSGAGELCACNCYFWVKRV